ncbi:MAG: hypothetical protein JNL70_12245 [Saprospiraceae bacterium]|nr:hypothetical protein [Saprospiraceae bacterium]
MADNSKELEKQEPQLPQVDEDAIALIDGFLGKERATEIVKFINQFLAAQAESKIQKIQNERLEIENQVRLTELQKEQQKNEQTFISFFDIRSKMFALLAMVIVLFSLYKFNEQGSVDKEFTKTIFTVITSIISIGGLNLVSEILNRKKQN